MYFTCKIQVNSQVFELHGQLLLFAGIECHVFLLAAEQ